MADGFLEKLAVTISFNLRILPENVGFFLSLRVFQLMSLMDAQLPQSSNEKVELAILWFMDQFRKTYVGDQLQHTSKVNICSKPQH